MSVSPACFAALRDAMYSWSFAPGDARERRVGAEVELLAYDTGSSRLVPLEQGGRGLVPALRNFAARVGWREFVAYDGTPRFDIPGRAVVSFEPGGQIEISSVPSTDPTQLVALLRSIVDPLRSGLAEEGIDLRSVGLDPYNDARRIPLQLPVERYQRMTDYFDRLGPFGIRMMRQTAAIQISVDRGDRPAARWRLLNDLAPYLIALFANSPRYLGRDTGHQSFRAHCWRQLDSTRTGVADDAVDPAAEYVRFALSANDMMRTDADGAYRAFDAWMAEDESDARWSSHLTTLFPEVRPRGHFEVRSCDAVAPDWYGVPIVFVAGLVYDARSSAEAALLAAESRALLRVAGEQGLGDRAIARTARDLFQLALDGAERLGDAFVSPELRELGAAFYSVYTARGRSPADDAPASPDCPAHTTVSAPS